LISGIIHPTSQYISSKRGRLGFDEGRETIGACRGAEFLANPTANFTVANDDNYALAA
jgi:hypothetical protein